MLALGVLLLLAARESRAQTEPDGAVKIRKAVTDPAAVKEGSYFRFHEKALAHRLPANLESQLAGHLEILRRRPPDELARGYLDAHDGAGSDELTIAYIRQTTQADDGQLDRALQATRNVVQMPDGYRLPLPVPKSHGLHLWLMRAHSEALLGHATRPGLTGHHLVEVSGECPFASGPITFTQRDFRVEGTRGDRLLLSGALGDTAAWFVASEIRYSTVTMAGDKVAGLAVPDRPSEIYRAALGSAELRLSGSGSASCSMTLRPAHSTTMLDGSHQRPALAP